MADPQDNPRPEPVDSAPIPAELERETQGGRPDEQVNDQSMRVQPEEELFNQNIQMGTRSPSVDRDEHLGSDRSSERDSSAHDPRFTSSETGLVSPRREGHEDAARHQPHPHGVGVKLIGEQLFNIRVAHLNMLLGR